MNTQAFQIWKGHQDIPRKQTNKKIKLYLQNKKLFTKHKSSPFNNAIQAQPSRQTPLMKSNYKDCGTKILNKPILNRPKLI